ncbi:AAA family ATPase [Thalassovita sp.]|uniref:AAA family ATPase n=1 Tax=Thalassovita sp. TaxID=1979401 RepID=UPI002AB0A1D3|nr:AAA family ATPase [Thalassovita sp.]
MITITGAEGSSEYQAAILVKNALEASWPGVAATPREVDDIRIAVSTKLSGYQVQDIDVVLAGRLSKPRMFKPLRVIRGSSGNKLNTRPIMVESFVVAIEVKDHDDRGVRIMDDQVEVRYSRGGPLQWKSATDQNVKQMHALKTYLSDMHVDVFARRCMVFPSLGSISAPSAVAGAFNGHQLMSAIAASSPLLERRGQGLLSAGDKETIEKALAAPIFKKAIPTRLDRERMDRLAAKNPAIDGIIDTLGDGTVFLRGFAGTGKTVLLLQAAWKLFRMEGKRTLVLTYNHALAADMRRLMSLASIPSSVQAGGIRVGTVMSFLYTWFSKLGLLGDGPLDFSRYPELCAEALELIKAGAVTRDDIEAIIYDDPDFFDFDQVFVDEGQDWPSGETALLKALYDPTRLCVADGVDQLVRGARANWRAGLPRDKRSTLPLGKCLRLKRNLSLFVSEVARETGSAWEAEPNPAAGGGRIIILNTPYAQAAGLHERLVGDLRSDGNDCVDMLVCVPPDGVVGDGSRRSSLVGREMTSWGQEFWDGVDPTARSDFPRGPDQVRIVQYASCRGLEGWTVVLDGFDRFLEEMFEAKISSGLDASEEEGFVDLEKAAQGEAWRWGLIALTRPIDTLVIQLDDPGGRFGTQVLEAARKFPDFVEILDD